MTTILTPLGRYENAAHYLAIQLIVAQLPQNVQFVVLSTPLHHVARPMPSKLEIDVLPMLTTQCRKLAAHHPNAAPNTQTLTGARLDKRTDN